MLTTLPVLHRRLLAVLLAALVTVEATWLSTRVGDDNPTWWGVAGGLVLGLLVDAMLLRPGRLHRT
jgi:hypothetical protein